LALPGKNLRPLHGKPLIGYSIEVARASRRLTAVVTSTDSAEIAEVAQAAGSEVVMRPAQLAGDETPMLPVIQHAVTVLEREWGEEIARIVLLQPTSPLRTAEDIDAAVELLSPEVDAVASVYAVPKKYHPQRLMRLTNGLIRPYLEGARAGVPRQQLPEIHKLNGAVYVMWRATAMEKRSVLGERTAAYLMPPERSVDIDDELDFLLAESLLRAPERAGHARVG
jgi:CMP-N-acetylneuraminic acid synthetase